MKKLEDLLKTPREDERNFILKHVYRVIPESVPPIAVYGVLGIAGIIIIRGVLK